LRDATQAPEGMPETATKHVAFVDGGYQERLEGGNSESKQA